MSNDTNCIDDADSFIYKGKLVTIDNQKTYNTWIKRFNRHSKCVVYLVQHDIGEYWKLCYALQDYALTHGIMTDDNFNY